MKPDQHNDEPGNGCCSLAQLLEAWAALGIGAGLTLGGLRDVAVQREAHSMVWQFKAVTSSSRSREMRLRRSNCPMAAVYQVTRCLKALQSPEMHGKALSALEL